MQMQMQSVSLKINYKFAKVLRGLTNTAHSKRAWCGDYAENRIQKLYGETRTHWLTARLSNDIWFARGADDMLSPFHFTYHIVMLLVMMIMMAVVGIAYTKAQAHTLTPIIISQSRPNSSWIRNKKCQNFAFNIHQKEIRCVNGVIQHLLSRFCFCFFT